jgi:hypothetical protein
MTFQPWQPILYQGAIPILFIEVKFDTQMCPVALEEAIVDRHPKGKPQSNNSLWNFMEFRIR